MANPGGRGSAPLEMLKVTNLPSSMCSTCEGRPLLGLDNFPVFSLLLSIIHGKKITYDSEFSFLVLLNIPWKVVTIISRSTYFKELLFTFINFLHILHCLVNFMFSLANHVYREACSNIYYNGMGCNYSYAYKLSLLCSKHNDSQWSIDGGGGGVQAPLILVNLL